MPLDYQVQEALKILARYKHVSKGDFILRRVGATAIAAHEALGLRHISRTDLILQPDGTIQFLEVNVAPGMTETSLLPQAVVASGWALPALYRSVVENALPAPVV